jgi:hypothetical protein
MYFLSESSVSIHERSSWSRKKLTSFLSCLCGKKVSESTVTKVCRFIGFPKDAPILISKVHLVYLAMICKESFSEGKNTSYEYTLTSLGIDVDATEETLWRVWEHVERLGFLSAREFKVKVMEFHNNQ